MMPSFAGATGWLNLGPLDPPVLEGRVVLVHFWTLTCINWLRQEPYVRAWSQAYRNDGLVVIERLGPDHRRPPDPTPTLVREHVHARNDAREQRTLGGLPNPPVELDVVLD